MIVTTVRTYDGTKLYLDSRGNVDNGILVIARNVNRYQFERLSILTHEQVCRVMLAATPLPREQHKQR
jgi:hypothetical protein